MTFVCTRAGRNELAKKYNIQFFLSNSPVTFQIPLWPTQNLWEFYESVKIDGGYHHTKLKWSWLQKAKVETVEG